MRAGRFLVSSLSLALGLACVGVTAPAAAEEPGWGPIVDVSKPRRYTDVPELAVDRVGNTAVVWVHGGDRPRLFLAVRRQETWPVPEAVPGSRGVSEAEVAFDGDGDLTVAWAAGRRVRMVRRTAGGSWGEPRTLHRTPTGALGTRPVDVDLAVNSRGRAVVSWSTQDDFLDRTYARSKVQAVVGGPGARWSPARTLSSADRHGSNAKVAMSRAGRATVVWDESDDRTASVMIASRAPGQGWLRSRALVRGDSAGNQPQLAALPSGELAVAWFGGETTYEIKLRRWRPGDGWSRVTAVPGLKSSPSWLTIGMDGSGTVTVAWSNSIEAVWVAVHEPGQGWTRTRIAPPGSRYLRLSLAVNRAGDGVIGWDGKADDRRVAQAAYRPRGGSWGPATTVSDPAVYELGIAVALEGDGSATATWLAGTMVHARTYEPR